MNHKYAFIGIGFLFLILAAVFHFSSPNLADNDSFYYFGLANLFKERGLFNAEFPWIYYSPIRELSVSLWYGFGVLMIPFSYLGIAGIKVAGVILTAAALFAFYFVLQRLQIKAPLFWTFFLFFAAPNVVYRFLMIRPQLISAALVILFFYFLITNKFWPVLLTALGIAWFHTNLFWLPILILAIVVFWQFVLERKINPKILLGVIAGAAAGLFLRPNPLGAVKLVYIQVFKQIFERQAVPLLVGGEHLPLLPITLLRNFWGVTLVWLAALIMFFIFWKLIKKSSPRYLQTGLLSSASLSILFFALTMLLARRAYDLWVPFSLIFSGSLFTVASLCWRSQSRQAFYDAAKILLLLLLIFNAFYSIYRTEMSLKAAYQPERMKKVAEWLKDNSQIGDIVFNLRWPRFSELFYWNQKNYYVGGLDPIFQYAYDPNLYWKFHYLMADMVTDKTCGFTECTEGMMEDTYEVLKRDFRAKYVVADKIQNPAVYSFLNADPRFENKFEDNRETVFALK
jgi:hypothetical protein